MKTQIQLADQLEEQKNKVVTNLPQETVEVLLNTSKKLAESGIADHSLQVGTKAPDFELPDATGKKVKLSDLLKNGIVVLNFYRGEWCPYCNLEIRSLQQSLPEFEQYNAQIVAISPELPDKSLTMQEKHELAFPVVSDRGNMVARDYGLVFTLDPSLIPIYEDFGIDLPASNGDQSYELPIPATYVVDQEGIIRYAYINTDYTQRAEPADILEAISKI